MDITGDSPEKDKIPSPKPADNDVLPTFIPLGSDLPPPQDDVSLWKGKVKPGLTKEQREIVTLCKRGHHSFISGVAGTGKSHVLRV